MIEPLLTASEVGTRLGISPDRVLRLAEAGAIRAVRLTPRTLRFDERDVEIYRTSAAPLMLVGAPCPQPRFGTVYFVRSGDYMKIGFTTKSMPERMKYLQTGNPIKMELAYASLNVECSFEKALHRLLSAARYREEWFYVDRELFHPAGDRLASVKKFITALAKNEADALAEYKMPWRRGP